MICMHFDDIWVGRREYLNAYGSLVSPSLRLYLCGLLEYCLFGLLVYCHGTPGSGPSIFSPEVMVVIIVFPAFMVTFHKDVSP